MEFENRSTIDAESPVDARLIARGGFRPEQDQHSMDWQVVLVIDERIVPHQLPRDAQTGIGFQFQVQQRGTLAVDSENPIRLQRRRQIGIEGRARARRYSGEPCEAARPVIRAKIDHRIQRRIEGLGQSDVSRDAGYSVLFQFDRIHRVFRDDDGPLAFRVERDCSVFYR